MLLGTLFPKEAARVHAGRPGRGPAGVLYSGLPRAVPRRDGPQGTDLSETMRFLPSARGAVVSGGGAWGAYSIGILSALRPDYSLVAGISTGALQAPLIALGEYDRLAEAYSNVDLDSIFTKRPFTRKGKVRWLRVAGKLLTFQHSVGEMGNLRKLIAKFYTREDHERVKASGKIVIVGAVNMTLEPHLLELFSPHIHDYDTFCAAMYASSCFYPIGEMAPIGEDHYVDGGFLESIIIDEAIEAGCRDLDVFVLKHQQEFKRRRRPRHMLEGLWRIAKAWRYDTVYENLEKAVRKADKDPNTTIHVWRPPHKLSENAMYFDKAQMRGWVQLGSQQSLRGPR